MSYFSSHVVFTNDFTESSTSYLAVAVNGQYVPQVGIVVLTVCDGVTCLSVQSSVRVDDGAWHHITVLRSSAAVTLAVDCNTYTMAGAAGLASAWEADDGISVGSTATGGFHGILISSLHLYGAAQALTSLGQKACGTCVLYYPFSNDSVYANHVVSDVSGWGNDGLVEKFDFVHLSAMAPPYQACSGACILCTFLSLCLLHDPSSRLACPLT